MDTSHGDNFSVLKIGELILLVSFSGSRVCLDALLVLRTRNHMRSNRRKDVANQPNALGREHKIDIIDHITMARGKRRHRISFLHIHE